jgi:hypothetical protein
MLSGKGIYLVLKKNTKWPSEEDVELRGMVWRVCVKVSVLFFRCIR